MSEWRDHGELCDHSERLAHIPRYVRSRGDPIKDTAFCPGGRPVTDADIMARAAKLADYEAGGAMFDAIVSGRNDAEDNSDAGAARLVFAAALGVDDDQ